VLWPLKLLVRPREDLVELYDVERDHAEQLDLSTREAARTGELMRLLRALPPVQVDRSLRARRAREEASRRPN
jgi:hypothetical protein